MAMIRKILIPLTTAAAAAAAAIGPYAVRGMAEETEKRRSRLTILVCKHATGH